MRKFYHQAPSTSGGKINREYFEKVTDKLPTEPGEYITNFGGLIFDGETFRMNGDKKFPTVVEWWLMPHKP